MINAFSISTNFILGLLSSFSPCLFPLFPTYVAVTAKTENNRKTSVLSSFFLVAGIIVVFLSLGLIVSGAVRVFLLTNYTTFARIQGVLIAISGILLIKQPSFLSKIQLPNKFYDYLYQDEEKINPYVFSFLIGLVYTIIAAPCAGGYFFAVWTSFINFNFIEQLILVIVFGIGAGIPFILSAFIVPKFRENLSATMSNASHKISIVLGIILIITGIWLYNSTGQIGIANVG